MHRSGGRITAFNSRKSILFARILPTLKDKRAFFSLAAVKSAVVVANIELSDDTFREYMSEAMKTGIVNDADRGWYSRHTAPVRLDPKPVADVERYVRPGEKTVVLRPSIVKQPECKDHVAPMEKALVDLIEAPSCG